MRVQFRQAQINEESTRGNDQTDWICELSKQHSTLKTAIPQMTNTHFTCNQLLGCSFFIASMIDSRNPFDYNEWLTEYMQPPLHIYGFAIINLLNLTLPYQIKLSSICVPNSIHVVSRFDCVFLRLFYQYLCWIQRYHIESIVFNLFNEIL